MAIKLYQCWFNKAKQANINGDGTSPGSNNDSTVLPLFGKKTYDGSRHWNYYTVSNNNVKIQDQQLKTKIVQKTEVAKNEDNSIVNIDEYNGEFKVKIYNFDKPKIYSLCINKFCVIIIIMILIISLLIVLILMFLVIS